MDSYIKGNNNGSYEKINSTNGSLDANITNIPSVQITNAPNVSNILNQVDVNVNNAPNITSIINDVDVRVVNTPTVNSHMYGEYTYVIEGGQFVQVGTVNVPPSLHKEDNTEYNYSEYILKSQINNFPVDYSDNYMNLNGESVMLHCHKKFPINTFSSITRDTSSVILIPIDTITTGVVSVVSSSVNDTSTGSHARTLTIDGLDASGNVLSETISLNGTTSVNSTNSFSRVNKTTVATFGTSNYNEGWITTTDSGGVHLSYISGGFGSSVEPFFTIPAGKTGVVKNININHNCTNGDIDVSCYVYKENDVRIVAYIFPELFNSINTDTNLILNGGDTIMFAGTNNSGSVQYTINVTASIYYK